MIAMISMIATLAGASQDRLAQCVSPMVEIDGRGTVVSGAKDALIHAYRSGAALRVGWSLDWNDDGEIDITHWADAGFLSEYKGELFAQVSSIHRQRPQREAAIHLTPSAQKWTAIIGTTGELNSKMDGDAPKSRSVATQWCVVEPALSACIDGWRLMVQTDTNGDVLAGAREALFDAVRRGWPLRVAWGSRSGDNPSRSVEHVAEPVFVTITAGQELHAQLPEHIAQASYWRNENAQFDEPAVMWRGLLSTSGRFDAAWVNRATGETLRRMPQRARTSWFADASCPTRPPVHLATSGGVTLDESQEAD